MIIAQVQSDDIDHAVEATRPFFPDFSAAEGDEPVSFTLIAYRSAGLSFLDCSTAGMEARTSSESEAFGACVLDIEGEMTAGRDTIDPTQPFAILPAYAANIIRLRSQVLQIDDDVLTRFVAYDVGREHFPLRMLGYNPISPEAAAYWRSVNDFVRERMADGSADNPLIAASLQQLVLAAYLHVFPNTWADARIPRDGARVAPASLRRAKTYIEEHAHEPVTVLDIAQAARMSPRGLQEAFRREYDTTPMTYLHTVRLSGVRADLIAANPLEGATVGDIARRWGFTHLSRFSLRYREAFGESPSTTLRR